MDSEIATTQSGILQEYGVADSQVVLAVLKENIGETKLSPFDLDRIRVPASGGTTWEIPTLTGEVAAKSFHGIIVTWKEGRSYWSQRYGGESSPPDCASADGITGVGKPGGDCLTCPHSQWGTATGPKGEPSRGQACRTIRLLFTMLEGNVLPVVVSVPPTSLKPCRTYFLRLAQRAIPYYGVVTEFSLVKGDLASMIEFAPKDFLPKETYAKIKAYANELQPLVEAVNPAASDFDGVGK